MKIYDKVRVTKNCKRYNDEGVYAGMVGTIILAEIRNNKFMVCFIDERVNDKEFMSIEENMYKLEDDILCDINIADLELVKDNHATDETILSELPSPDPRWWCKVEDGYILNFDGERQNKIAYDYNS